MRHSLLAAALLLALSPAVPAQQPPASTLSIPEIVPIDTFFFMCLHAPGNSLAVLMVDTQGGATPSKYGVIQMSFPFLIVLPITMPPSGELCVRVIAHCDRVVPGFKLHMQFISLGPQPQQSGLSNHTALTFAEAGNCLPGEHITFSQSAYLGPCNQFEASCILQLAFDPVFPSGLLLGDQDGLDGDSHYAVKLTSAAAVQAFLPLAPSQLPFSADVTNPTTSVAGQLAGQLAIAKLNVAFDDFGALDAYKTSPTSVKLGDMIFALYVDPQFAGLKVRDVVALADKALAGEIAMPADVDQDGTPETTFGAFEHVLKSFNDNYADGIGNNQVIANPVP